MPILQKVTYMTAMQMARNGNPVARHDWNETKQLGTLTPMVVFVGATENLAPEKDTPYANFQQKSLTIKEHFDKWEQGKVTVGWKASIADMNNNDWYAVFPDIMQKKYDEFKAKQAKEQAAKLQKQLQEEAKRKADEFQTQEVDKEIAKMKDKGQGFEGDKEIEVGDEPEVKPKAKPKAKPKPKAKKK